MFLWICTRRRRGEGESLLGGRFGGGRERGERDRDERAQKPGRLRRKAKICSSLPELDDEFDRLRQVQSGAQVTRKSRRLCARACVTRIGGREGRGRVVVSTFAVRRSKGWRRLSSLVLFRRSSLSPSDRFRRHSIFRHAQLLLLLRPCAHLHRLLFRPSHRKN